MVETSQVLDLFKLLITELFPTLGYPMTPTVTALLDPSTFEICLISWIKWSAPIALVVWMRVSASYVPSAIDFLYKLNEERLDCWFCKLALNITTGNYLLK